MRPYLITAKLMRPSNMKRFPTPGLEENWAHDDNKNGHGQCPFYTTTKDKGWYIS